MPAADAVAPDAGSRSRDAEARDAAPVRAEAPPLEASAVRSEAPGQEIADTRADRAALDLKPVPDGASPEGPAGDATDPGADSGETACKLDGSAAAMAHLTPLELKTLLDSSEDPFLINVKGASIDDIPGTDAVLANDLPGIEALVGRDHCANIVLYCASGMTSQSVGGQLIANGYLRVRDLAGGIKAWTNAGYPTQ